MKSTAAPTGGSGVTAPPAMLGTAFVHTAVDDCSRVAYAEICVDETIATATAVLRRAPPGVASR